MEKQTTIKDKIQLCGKGLHTGQNVRVTLLPAAANCGVIFRRVDIEGSPEIPALVTYVGDTSRGTTLHKNGVRIATIEHLLSALTGLNVDNVVIELDGDGSLGVKSVLGHYEVGSNLVTADEITAGKGADHACEKNYDKKERCDDSFHVFFILFFLLSFILINSMPRGIQINP